MQNGYVREQGGASSVASASEHNSDQLQAVGESLFVPNPDFLTEQKQDDASLAAQSGSPQPDSSTNTDTPRSEAGVQLGNAWPTSLAGRHADTAPASANTLSAPAGAEKNGAVANQILNLENGSATPKELEKLSNVAERKVAQARIESGDNPAQFALLIARARREQIESAKGVKS